MRRNIGIAAVALLLGAGAVAWVAHGTRRPAQQLVARQGPGEAGPTLPLSQVVLFSSGVGYFQREGEVEGNARVDLQFPIGDVNDLLKSLVLQDLGKGKVGAISYDGQDPVEKTLRSFAVDLTGNPTFGQLLNQARGEKVEVVMQQTAGGQPGTVTGVIMGMESEAQAVGTAMQEVHLLNLVCAEGVRSVKLRDVQRIRFLNARLEGELKRALEVVAASHDAQKKQVSLNFKGDGRRKVRVGYVAENPIWKTSYRLTLDRAAAIQGWAAVENVTDEDWNDVRVVLVSGRPISYQMDLYPPLYVPRPTVEPERFASLRPPTYNGAMTNERAVAMNPGMGGNFVGFGGFAGQQGNNLGVGGGLAGIGGVAGLGGLGGGLGGGGLGLGGGQLGQQGGQFGMPGNNRYQNPVNPMQQLGQNRPRSGMDDEEGTPGPAGNRLSYEKMQERLKQKKEALSKNIDDAKKVGAAVASSIDPHESIASVAAAEEIGDAFRYVIEERVSLPRQKSALLPLLDRPIGAARVSIYNEGVHAKFPLLGLRFKNTTGQPLTQGPVTVYEDGSYAGDARLPDLQADEERLISYAIDLGTEVKTEDRLTPGTASALRTGDNVMHVQYMVRHTRKYTIRNRSKQDRLLVIEHPVNSSWKLAKDQKPREESRDVYRFDVPVKAGATATFEVAVEQGRTDQFPQQWSKSPAADVVESRFTTGLGLDVDRVVKSAPDELLTVKIEKGELKLTTKHSHTLTYRVLNRSKEDRKITVEHLTPANWALVGETKPVEGTTSLYRFPLEAKAGAAATQDVTEQRTAAAAQPLAAMTEETIRFYQAHPATPAKVKDALRTLAEQKTGLAELQRQIEDIDRQLKEISEDQARLRQNLDKVPKESEAHKRYVKKFDDQETQIEKLQEQQKEKKAAVKQAQKSLDDAVKGLTAE